jgi:hypothetical protein
MGNPAIFPLIYGCDSREVVIIHINPLERAKLPTTASDIMNRINEISFNSSLMREMRAIAFVTKLIDDGKILDNPMKRMLIHGTDAADVMAELGALNKLNADWDNLNHLMKVERERTEAWLKQNFGRLGEESTVDIREEFLRPSRRCCRNRGSAITGAHPHNSQSAFPPAYPAPYIPPRTTGAAFSRTGDSTRSRRDGRQRGDGAVDEPP